MASAPGASDQSLAGIVSWVRFGLRAEVSTPDNIAHDGRTVVSAANAKAMMRSASAARQDSEIRRRTNFFRPLPWADFDPAPGSGLRRLSSSAALEDTSAAPSNGPLVASPPSSVGDDTPPIGPLNDTQPSGLDDDATSPFVGITQPFIIASAVPWLDSVGEFLDDEDDWMPPLEPVGGGLGEEDEAMPPAAPDRLIEAETEIASPESDAFETWLRENTWSPVDASDGIDESQDHMSSDATASASAAVDAVSAPVDTASAAVASASAAVASTAWTRMVTRAPAETSQYNHDFKRTRL